MRTLTQFIKEGIFKDKLDPEKLPYPRGDIQFKIYDQFGELKKTLKNNTDYQKIEFQLREKKEGIYADFLLGFEEGSWKMWIGKIGVCSYDQQPYKDFETDDFNTAITKSIDEIELLIQKILKDKENYTEFLKDM